MKINVPISGLISVRSAKVQNALFSNDDVFCGFIPVERRLVSETEFRAQFSVAMAPGVRTMIT